MYLFIYDEPAFNIRYISFKGPEDLWIRIITEVPQFTWDDDDETQPSTVKSRSTKKPTAKDQNIVKVYILLATSARFHLLYLAPTSHNGMF